MVKDKFNRHAIAVLAFSLSSAALYFSAQTGANGLIRILLGIDVLAIYLALTTR